MTTWAFNEEQLASALKAYCQHVGAPLPQMASYDLADEIRGFLTSDAAREHKLIVEHESDDT